MPTGMPGMLPGMFSPQFKDVELEKQDEEQRQQFLAADPLRALSYEANSLSRDAGRGLGHAVGGAMGYDTRSAQDKYQQAVQQANDEMSKLDLDPNDPKSLDIFNGKLVDILRRNGLTNEAAAVMQQWQTNKRQGKLDQLKVDELQRKKDKDAATNAASKERNEILRQRLGKQGDKLIQFLDEYESLDQEDPANAMRLTTLKQAIDNMVAGKGWKAVAGLGNRVEILDKDGNTIRTLDAEASPKDDAKKGQALAQVENGYAADKANLQQTYNAVAELFRMPGLKDALGTWRGLASQTTPENAGSIVNLINRGTMSQKASDAVAKIRQVQGGVFISALKDLKAASPKTGATGLGQLTEVEGAKIQNAKAALDPQQGYPSYRKNLAQYMEQIKESSRLMDEAVKRYDPDVTIRPLALQNVGGPVTAPVAPQAPLAPPQQPQQPAVTPVAPAPDAKIAPAGDGWSIRKK